MRSETSVQIKPLLRKLKYHDKKRQIYQRQEYQKERMLLLSQLNRILHDKLGKKHNYICHIYIKNSFSKNYNYNKGKSIIFKILQFIL